MKAITTISSLLAVIFGITIGLYVFTPIFDEWIIENSLERLCAHLKEDFSGEIYSPAYICTFMDPSP